MAVVDGLAQAERHLLVETYRAVLEAARATNPEAQLWVADYPSPVSGELCPGVGYAPDRGLGLRALRPLWHLADDDDVHRHGAPRAVSIAVAVAAIVLGTLAAILPARRAARLEVIEALSYE
jgi:hypothetical protein